MKILGENDINEACNILKSGGLVAIPTETVYGLAANALNKKAVKSIFKAKGRPPDNPLIVHISSLQDINYLACKIPEVYYKLAEKFWPGPLTMILRCSSIVPDEVNCGLKTIAVRFPANNIAVNIIKGCGFPLAAPSANLSGKPSPTSVEHVIEDMQGRIDAVVDGGICKIGVESTVVDLTGDIPLVLRPGGITVNKIREIVGKVNIHSSIYGSLNVNVKPVSPGMKYKHYSPKAKIRIIDANQNEYIKFMNTCKEERAFALCNDEDIPFLKAPFVSYGSRFDAAQQARNLFGALRRLDALGAALAYARIPERSDEGLALYNRLMRAAGFEEIKIEH